MAKNKRLPEKYTLIKTLKDNRISVINEEKELMMTMDCPNGTDFIDFNSPLEATQWIEKHYVMWGRFGGYKLKAEVAYKVIVSGPTPTK